MKDRTRINLSLQPFFQILVVLLSSLVELLVLKNQNVESLLMGVSSFHDSRLVSRSHVCSRSKFGFKETRCRRRLAKDNNDVAVDVSNESKLKNVYSPDIKGGRVPNMESHVRLLDQSLKTSSGEGIFDRINNILWEEYYATKTSNSTTTMSGDCDSPSTPPNNITSVAELDQNTRFAILSHGIQKDPIFNYANQAALTLFDNTIDEMCMTPSRKSTVPHLEQDRNQTLTKISKSNYGYLTNAIRQTSKGKLFRITSILYWNVYNDTDAQTLVGNAALYDSKMCSPL